jgi:hypothetical protein
MQQIRRSPGWSVPVPPTHSAPRVQPLVVERGVKDMGAHSIARAARCQSARRIRLRRRAMFQALRTRATRIL